MPLAIVDAGILYAMADRDDAWHGRLRAYLQTQTDTLIVPVTVLPEACSLLILPDPYLAGAVSARRG